MSVFDRAAPKRVIHFLSEMYAGRRLVICVVIGVLVYLALPVRLGLAIRIVAAWDLLVLLFLLGTALAMRDSRPERMRRRAGRQDEKRWVMLALTITASALSFVAITFLLHKDDAESALHMALRVGLAAATVLFSWSLVHTVFALHYNHLFYGDDEDNIGGLEFPGQKQPDYWDFLYYSFVIGMTSQVSDVQVSDRAIRRVTLLHGVLSFLFNTAILALTINILASLIGGS
jgi:uncharacterized membrane protein